MAAQLGYSYSYLDNVLAARKPYGGKLKATIQQLARDHEQTRPAPLSPLNQDYPRLGPEYTEQVVEAMQPLTNKLSSWSEPADIPPASDYAVIDATDGTAVLVEILARFNNHTAARKICRKLNGENG